MAVRGDASSNTIATSQNEPLISIVIPAYNAERYIERSLRSACAQTYGNTEIIVVNDGSSDQTHAIVAGVAATDHRVQVLHQDNLGSSSARNLGVRESTGDFVAFLDADDLWHPTKLEKQLNRFLESEMELALVYTWTRMIDIADFVDGATGARSHRRGMVFKQLLERNPISLHRILRLRSSWHIPRVGRDR